MKKLKQIKTPIIGSIINCISEESANSNLLSGNYAYGNPYNYYSYKYMPSETQDRYSVPENDINSIRNIIDKFFTQTTLKEKQ